MSTQNIDNPKTLEDWKAVISIKVNSKGKSRLTEKNIIDIAELNDTIELLNKHGITSKNYRSKVKGYFAFRKKALEEYGIDLDVFYPFKNPTKLYMEIHTILVNAELNAAQIKAFYNVSEIRKSMPTKKQVEKAKVFKGFKVDKTSLFDEPTQKELDWELLSPSEQRKIIGITDEEYEQELQEQEEMTAYFRDYNLKKEKLKEKFKYIQRKCLLS
jgi:hypothetical protein